MFKEVLTGVGR